MAKYKDKRVEIIDCKCGCGKTLNKYDGNYRTREYISGHNNRKYADPLAYKRVWWEANKEVTKEHRGTVKKARRSRFKDELLNRRGKECANCNVQYDGTNAPMFDLHHVIPSNKLFEVAGKAVQNHSKKKVLLESDKCVVLCSNCHRLHHHTDKIIIPKEVEREFRNKNTLQNLRKFYRTRCLRPV